jgi:hypothetical protein
MNKFLIVGLLTSLLALPAAAEPPTACDNIGQLTKWSIQNLEGYEQGPHASDPSGDGHGKDTLDEPRVGLPNLIEQGELGLTLGLLVSLLTPPCE